MSNEYPFTVAVSFGAAPDEQRDAKIDALRRAGWEIVREIDGQPIAFFRKVYLEAISERQTELEIRELMQPHYVNLAAPGSPRDLGSEGDPGLTPGPHTGAFDAGQPQIVAEGGSQTVLPPEDDPSAAT